ncbi:MAG: hypothetical protein ACTSRZ_02300 [Promethearchaeota archaeon]
MHIYEKEQKVVEIAGIKIGGQPGENPVVMIGSLFYRTHKACKNPKTGEIDKEIAINDINIMIEWSQKTGLPIIFDLIGETAEALVNYAQFVSEVAPEIPFLVDGLSDRSRIPAMRELKDLGLLDYAILNSIDHETKDETLKEIKDIGVKYAILLAFEKISLSPKKKLQFIKGDSKKYKGLLQKAEEAGIKDFLIDTAVLDIISLGICAETQHLVKKELGLPVGCAPANAVFEWQRGKELFGKEGRIIADAAVCTFLRDYSADFILFGAAKHADKIFPSIAVHESIVSYYQKRYNKIKINHEIPKKVL